MKIAVPTRGVNVDDHFGHCEFYTIFTVEGKKIENAEVLPSPQGCGCKSNIAGILKEKGVSIMLAGSMGNGAVEKLHHNGINVVRGCTGNVTELVQTFLEGTVEDSGVGCQQHGANHQCSH